MTEPICVNVTEVSGLLGVSRSMVYDLVASGKLTPRKLGGRTLFLYEDVQACVKALPTGLAKCRNPAGRPARKVRR